MVWFVAGVFVYMTIPITTAGKRCHMIFPCDSYTHVIRSRNTQPLPSPGVVQHLRNFSDPPQQLRIIRILFMVPVYSFFSYLGMILTQQTIYLDAVSYSHLV